MPAKRITRADRMRERFETMYRIGKAATGLKDTDVAEGIGLSVTSLWSRRKDPSKFSVGEMVKLAAILRWQESDILSLFTL